MNASYSLVKPSVNITEHIYYNFKCIHLDDIFQGEPHYEFNYGVRDTHTGDIKNQWEVRKGDEVKGEYSLVEADGTIRTVKYSADKHSGFNAIVTKHGKAKHPPSVRQHRNYGTGNHGAVATHSGFNFHTPANIKPVHPDPTPDFFPPRTKYGLYQSESSPKVFYAAPEVPSNHRPIYTGLNDQSDILAEYTRTQERQTYTPGKHHFDYGINEYMNKRNQNGQANSSFRLLPEPKGARKIKNFRPKHSFRSGR